MKKTILLMFFGAAIFFGCQKEDMNSDSANANVQKVYQLNTQSEVPFWEEATLVTEKSFSENNVQYKNANVTHMHGNFTGFGGSVSVTFNGTVNNSGAQGQAEFTQVLGGPFGTANFTDASNKRLMTDAQETKLDSVESNATADQSDSEIK